ncbi:hypothetical protein [Sporosalibacterium faouarense]|uniref:hypothetical protein n=1 Tax=Sporosalibacterium faouarense TaxID=516123 RepID=UPI00141C8125|nr:hypothetical protein [Sporosalibacterium faouarense]MTI48134.1 hypothetical protein [Bacillota bacterium]
MKPHVFIRKKDLIVLLFLLLLLSNFFFYSKYQLLKNDLGYDFRIARRVNIAVSEDSIEPIIELSSVKDKNFFNNILKEINTHISNRYQVENYVVIKYDNRNTLMLRVTENSAGTHLIEDIFFLDDDTSYKLMHNSPK